MTYTCPSLVERFDVKNRAEAIRNAESYLRTKKDNADLRGREYRWSAEDGSGFILELTSHGNVKLVRRINAERQHFGGT